MMPRPGAGFHNPPLCLLPDAVMSGNGSSRPGVDHSIHGDSYIAVSQYRLGFNNALQTR